MSEACLNLGFRIFVLFLLPLVFVFLFLDVFLVGIIVFVIRQHIYSLTSIRWILVVTQRELR